MNRKNKAVIGFLAFALMFGLVLGVNAAVVAKKPVAKPAVVKQVVKTVVKPKVVVKPVVKVAPKPVLGVKVVAKPVVAKPVAKVVEIVKTPAEIKARVNKFIAIALLADGTKFTLGEPTSYNSGLYLVKVKIDGQDGEVDSYITKNGDIFFPSAMAIDAVTKQALAAKEEAAKAPVEPAKPTEVVKTDKPVVQLFVMSYCPYGTQMEKAILPVVELLGDKMDYKLEFVSYTMHGAKETDENTLQYCIQKEEPTKFNAYLKCFLEAADSAGCLTKAGIDAVKLAACTTATNKTFSIDNTKTAYDVNKEDNTKYGVQGSPTLIINGVESSVSRDSESVKQAICASFTTQPEACKTVLPSTPASPGFGFEASASAPSATAGCGQ